MRKRKIPLTALQPPKIDPKFAKLFDLTGVTLHASHTKQAKRHSSIHGPLPLDSEDDDEEFDSDEDPFTRFKAEEKKRLERHKALTKQEADPEKPGEVKYLANKPLPPLNHSEDGDDEADPLKLPTLGGPAEEGKDKSKKKKKEEEENLDPKQFDMDLDIKKVKTSKDKIKQAKLATKYVIPRIGTSSLLNGSTGQGKSVLLANLMTDPRFFGDKVHPTFQHRFLISPTAEGDDVQKKLKIPKENTVTDLSEAPEIIDTIIQTQRKLVRDKGNDGAPQVAIIYDDVISDQEFCKNKHFIRSFIASRHFNITPFVLTQSYTYLPRVVRLQAKNIFFFASSLSEVELLFKEYCPPGLNRKQFFRLVADATAEPYAFLYINKSVKWKDRFRKNLDTLIDLDYYANLDTSTAKGKGGDQTLSVYASMENSGATASEGSTSHQDPTQTTHLNQNARETQGCASGGSSWR
jgi:hypothetical protein